MSKTLENIELLNINDFSYDLPDERIAKYPLDQRDNSKLLFFNNGEIENSKFKNIENHLPEGSLLVFNNTKVIRARLIFFKDSGARIEIFCLEPYMPADYERSLNSTERVQWKCMIGNAKKWKNGSLTTKFTHNGVEHVITATRVETVDNESVVEFCGHSVLNLTFGQILELLGKIPIPPYLNRNSEPSDDDRYQTVYSKFEGSVAAPTAGLHFTHDKVNSLKNRGFFTEEITLHVGAGTFLPVKSDQVSEHSMHIEHFDFTLETLKNIRTKIGNIIAVGTTSVRTLESIAVLGARIIIDGKPNESEPIGQWEAYHVSEYSGGDCLDALINYMERHCVNRLKSSTKIMITPYYRFKIIRGLVTNFHQPQSTLLLLISAVVGEKWREIYEFALRNDYRFLSYGDSSLLLINS